MTRQEILAYVADFVASGHRTQEAIDKLIVAVPPTEPCKLCKQPVNLTSSCWISISASRRVIEAMHVDCEKEIEVAAIAFSRLATKVGLAP